MNLTRLRSVFVVLTVAWAVLLPAAAFAASRPSGAWTGEYVLALAVYRLGSLLCHQRAERSFALFGAQLPVCARCAGIYAGAALTMVAARAWGRPPLRLSVDRRMLCGASAAPCRMTPDACRKMIRAEPVRRLAPLSPGSSTRASAASGRCRCMPYLVKNGVSRNPEVM